jgi:hypothetical protein
LFEEQVREASLMDEPPPHHEDERNLDTDGFDELIAVMSRIHRAVLGKLPQNRERLLSKDSNDGAGYNDETRRNERRPRSVVIEGSIGTGKSRLLSRLSDVLALEPTLLVGGASRPCGLTRRLVLGGDLQPV